MAYFLTHSVVFLTYHGSTSIVMNTIILQRFNAVSWAKEGHTWPVKVLSQQFPKLTFGDTPNLE